MKRVFVCRTRLVGFFLVFFSLSFFWGLKDGSPFVLGAVSQNQAKKSKAEVLEEEIRGQVFHYLRRKEGESYWGFKDRRESHSLILTNAVFNQSKKGSSYVEGLQALLKAFDHLAGNVIDFSDIQEIRIQSVEVPYREGDLLVFPGHYTEAHLAILREVELGSPPQLDEPEVDSKKPKIPYAFSRVIVRPKKGIPLLDEPNVIHRKKLSERRGDWIFYHAPVISPKVMASRLMETGRYEFVEPDYRVRLTGPVQLDEGPNDEFKKEQIGLFYPFGLNAFSAWKKLDYSDSEVVVAVIDSGVRTQHPDLAENLLPGMSIVEGDPLLEDHVGHGTHIAGIIAAVGNNETGIVGVSWKANVKVVPIKMTNGESVFVSHYIQAIDQVFKTGAKVVNASVVLNEYSQALRDAVKDLQHDGVIFVTSAGNDFENIDKNPTFPAAFNLKNIVSVGAIGYIGLLTSFSNYGRCTVDLFAPGSQILSTWIGKGKKKYEKMNGTSMAAPHVTGLVAQIWSRYPSFSMKQVIYAIRKGTIYSPTYEAAALSAGRAEMGAALQAAEDLFLGAPMEVIGPPKCPNGDFPDPTPKAGVSQGGSDGGGGGCGTLAIGSDSDWGGPSALGIYGLLLVSIWMFSRRTSRQTTAVISS